MLRSILLALAIASLLPPITSLTTQSQGQLTNCPLPDKWSLAVWSRPDDVPTGDAPRVAVGAKSFGLREVNHG